MPGLYSKYNKLVHVSGDLTAIVFSSVITYVLYHGAFSGLFASGYLKLLYFAIPAWFICTALISAYQLTRVTSMTSIILGVLKVTLLYILLVEATLNLLAIDLFPKNFRLIHYMLLSLLVMFWRLLVITAINIFRRKGYNSRKVIITGYGESGRELEQFFQDHPEYGYRFLGFFDDNANQQAANILGSIADVERYVIENEVNEIYCSPFDLKKNQVQELLEFVDNNMVRMKFLPGPHVLPNKNLKIDFYDILPVLVIRTLPLDDVINKFLKRTFDLVFSSIVIIFLLSWLLPLIGLIIRLDSKGPIFFSQERSGINNKTFRCLKLRSMYINSDANLLLTKRGDSRITPVGAFLRKTSLDELPQFFNVFLGQMSVVGPRPHMLKANREYALIANKYMVRQLVKPGITGLSQVRGYRGETSADYQVRGRVKLDLFYLENWSFFLDIKIIFITILNIVRGDEQAC
ncbi:undecaprenyl-phosphate glucose phosphotransferase [Pontibacter oryzae]|uniref:Undecaprenyl-phosphate glucose phosphotransferase n=1 Tax=Pontibacter oryzae TaxID=2304593 RepID=A0A399SBM1_9BACT|nr:undecaprenyl-phosphate glucose phosphotransferase [Pontibacter oryzae]RIJ41456.1 undecaprenyl-phosphate glucose phosphotransferase [Pontibacter oryzae]